MSEYQYYEFRAIDRPLGPQEMAELRALSTRADITPTSFTNSYQWGDFKGKPAALMDRYFDAFLYYANWGSRQLMLRLPRRFLDAEVAAAYADEETLAIRAKGDHFIIEFSSEDESGDDGVWEQEEGEWMSSLVMLRDELIRGDLRALYVGWLASFQARGFDAAEDDEIEADGDDFEEPPVPPGLAHLSAPLRTLAEFLRVDDELIEVAAAGSVGQPPAAPASADLARWVRELPAPDKDASLLRLLAEDGDGLLRADLMRQFREATTPRPARLAPGNGRRTIRQLLAARAALLAEKERKAAERAARERVRLDRERAEARAKHLDDLARREAATWREAEALIATKLPKNYDRAVALLVDLRDLARRANRAAEADARLRQLRQQHATKPSLMKRFDQHGLGPPG